MMYRTLLFIAVTGMLVSSCKEKKGELFSVEGTLKNTDAKMIYLEETPVATMQRIARDSARLDNQGRFQLKTEISEESIFNLRLDEEVYPFVSLINDTGKIKVEADFSNTQELYTVSGSPASQALKEYLNKSGVLMRDIYFMDKQIDSLTQAQVTDSMLALLKANRAGQAESLKNYTQRSITGAASPSLAMFILGTFQGIANNPGFRMEPFDNETVSSLINELAIKFPGHQSIASVKRMLDAQLNKAGLVGKPAPEITLPDTEGREVKLSSFRGKYVLVDFWASWCGPCRDENPNVVKAYDKFKNKNFTILGVSLDKSKAPWQKAIIDDKLNWTHISDLQWWSSIVVPLYNIQGIPFNVLVDPQGKVVAENLRGEALHETLESVLQ